MAESNVNLMVVLNTSFDLYEMIFGNHGVAWPFHGLTRLGAWQACVPAWLREVSRGMRTLIDNYTEYIVELLQRREIERQRRREVWLEYINSEVPRQVPWGQKDPSEPLRPSGWPLDLCPKTVFFTPNGWRKWLKRQPDAWSGK